MPNFERENVAQQGTYTHLKNVLNPIEHTKTHKNRQNRVFVGAKNVTFLKTTAVPLNQV